MPPHPSRPHDRNKVEAALAKLAAVDPEAATLLRSQATQPGWELRPPQNPNKSFKVDKDLVRRAKAKAAAGELTAVILAGARRFIAGGLEPSRTVKGAADSKEKVNVRVPADLEAALLERCAARSTELGWTVRPVNVFVAALEEFAPE